MDISCSSEQSSVETWVRISVSVSAICEVDDRLLDTLIDVSDSVHDDVVDVGEDCPELALLDELPPLFVTGIGLEASVEQLENELNIRWFE